MPEWPIAAESLAARLDLGFWRGLFDIHLDPLAFIDTRYRVVRANRALAEALGCRPEELAGRSCFEIFHGGTCPVETCPHTRLLRDGCAHASELSLAPLGGCYWVSVTPVFDDSGQLLGCLHIARNVTAYKKLEAELRAARDEVEARAVSREREMEKHLQFERLLVSLVLSLSRSVSEAELKASIKEAVSEIGASGGFGACAFWRVTEGRAFALASYEESSHGLPQMPVETSREDEPCLFEALERPGFVEAVSGDVERCAVGLPPLWPGDTAYALLAVRRISRSSTRLALSGERLRLLCQVMGDALRRQAGAVEAQSLREELARLDRMARLSQLAAALAHELNQPLAATLCNAQAAASMLDGSSPDIPEVRSALDDIVTSARRAGDVMRQTRALFTGGQQTRHLVDLRLLVDSTIKLLRGEIALSGAEVAARCEGAPPAVLGDIIQLQQVLTNLIRNALDAVRSAPEGSRRVTVEVLKTPDGSAELRVADSGPGFPEGMEEAIFVPFRTGKADGMGLGLPICRQIVNQHGGTITAKRQEGGGALLTVVLPRPDPDGAGPDGV